jgi:hypothetical protein
MRGALLGPCFKTGPSLRVNAEHPQTSAFASVLGHDVQLRGSIKGAVSAYAPRPFRNAPSAARAQRGEFIYDRLPFPAHHHRQKPCGRRSPAGTLPTGSKPRTPTNDFRGGLHYIRIDGLLATLAGCFAHFPHGTCMLSGSRMEI